MIVAEMERKKVGNSLETTFEYQRIKMGVESFKLGEDKRTTKKVAVDDGIVAMDPQWLVQLETFV